MEEKDHEVYSIIQKEYERQKNGTELIASENFASDSVLEALGSIMTNKYSEGQIGKRYYGGNEYIDEMESRTTRHSEGKSLTSSSIGLFGGWGKGALNKAIKNRLKI